MARSIKKRSPLAYKSLGEKSKKCRMKKYKNTPICKRYLLGKSCSRNKNSKDCKKFRQSRRKALSKRLDPSKRSDLKRLCKSKKFMGSRKCKNLRK
jgi:hypothetical protein